MLGFGDRKHPFSHILSVGLNPPFLLMLLYAGLIAAGTLLLKLPAAAHQSVGWMEALFTATSAVTVTGLIVLDTGSDFTVFGQAVIAALIQLGGLGLMTFAVLVLSTFGLDMRFGFRIMLREDLDRTSVSDLFRIVRVILKVVVVCIAVGTGLLAIVFVPEFGWRHGLWSALFHAVSAFNNAGFSLYSDSLSRWSDSPYVNITVPALFIIGGLGFAVLAEILGGRRWREWSLHSKLMITGTLALILFSVPAFALLEWHNPETLATKPLGERFWVSWFQAVTTRTAGFNTVDIGALYDETSLMMMSLMFVGGGSTSTAGGVKVTTAIVLLLATIAFFRRQREPVAFGRSIGPDQLLKVLALVTVGVMFILTGLMVLLVTHKVDFIDMAFEVVSAFGTVGLSRGATGELTPFGQFVICIIMFFGRVGPLTVGFFLAARTAPRIRYPSGQIFLG